MKGDFTRFSFDPTKHYSGVLMQQGRVQLDADWNEQIDTQTRYSQLVTTDLVGLTGAPQSGGGFHVTISSDAKHLALSPGRIYVDGLLCELNASTTYDQQTDYPGATVPPGVAKDVNGNWIYLAYLDVWSRHVTAIEDPSVAEIALGGPDTGTRRQTLAQVKLAALTSDGTPGGPAVSATDWGAITAPSQALLAAAAFVPDSPGSLGVGGAAGFVKLPGFASGAPDFSQGFAVEAWVYVNGANTTVPILYLSDVTSGTSLHTISLVGGATNGVASAPLVFTVGDTTYTAAGAMPPGQWTYVAAYVAAPVPATPQTPAIPTTVTIYANGSPLTFVTAGTVAVPPNAARPDVYLGSTTGAAVTFSAMLAEVRVWSRTGFTGPTASSRIAGNVANLAAYYKLNQTDLTTPVVNDSSSAGRNGAVTGTVTWSANGPALTAAGTSTAQYLGPENQLYRVEIHSVSAAGVVLFKWSRDNGSIASGAMLSQPSSGASPTQTLKLAAPVRDDVLGWGVGQWVEITTVPGDLQAVPGTLAQIEAIQGNMLTIAAVAAPAPGAVTVRRWDSNPQSATSTFSPPAAPATPWQSAWIPLEQGIAVQFSGKAPFKPGDYWVMPARTATQSLEWPLTASTQPAVLPPVGIQHRYAQLAKVYLTPAGNWVASVLPELRTTFPPMANAVFSTGVLTWDNTSVLVMGTFNVGTSTTPETSNFWGPINAHDGINVTGAPLNVTGQPINATGMINAEAGLTVTGAPLTVTGQPINAGGMVNAQAGLTVTGAGANIGASGAPQPLHVFGSLTVDSAFNANGGLNTTIIGAQAIILTAGINAQSGIFTGNVKVEGALEVDGPLNAESIVNANAGLAVTGTATVSQLITANGGLAMVDKDILLRAGDTNHGLRYAGAAGGTPFAGGPPVDGPVLYGFGGGGLGMTSGGNRYVLEWGSGLLGNYVDITGFVTVTGGLILDAGINAASGIINGNFTVKGTLSKAGGGFTVDHPVDPANKYFNHSFVESPERKNLYDGIAVCDDQGEAVIELPSWFETANGDLRYQLTALGKPAPNLHVAAEVANGRFTIGGGAPHLRVSWQVTGVRQDPWALANPLVVEEEKPAEKRGRYLHPELHGQPADRSEAAVRNVPKPA